MNSPKVFLFEFENDGMEPSKRYSFISLFFILKRLILIRCKEMARWLSEAEGVSDAYARMITAT